MEIKDRDRRRLTGPVRTVRTETAEYDESLIERPWLVETETFDEQGCLLETTFHNYQHPEYSSKTVFSYDAAGRLIEQSFQYLSGEAEGKSAYAYDSDGKLLGISSNGDQQRLFAYHANGKKAEETFIIPELDPKTRYGFSLSSDANSDYDRSFSCDGARQFKTLFDLRGHPKELHFLAEEGTVLGKVVFTIDACGRIIKDAQYSYAGLPASIPEGTEVPPELTKLFGGETPLSSSEIAYDHNGRRVEEIAQMAGVVLHKRTFTYDAKGRLTEEATYNEAGTLQQKGRIERDYDLMGNWIKKLVLGWKKDKCSYEPSAVYRRIITYYDACNSLK